MSAQGVIDLMVVQEMALFLRFGNLEELVRRLDLAKANPGKIDDAIASEIVKFIEQKKDPGLRARIRPFLQGEGAHLADPSTTSHFRALEEKWMIFSEALDLLLRPQVEQAEKALPHLFIDAARSSAIRAVQRKTPLMVTSSSSLLTPSPSSQPEQPLSTGVSSSQISSSSEPTTPSFSSQLQLSRASVQQMSAGLCIGRHELTQQALKDGFQHFDDLLCSMRRLHGSMQGAPLTPQQLHAFVVDCVHHCSLGVEQILSALDRDSNKIVTQEQLKPRLTHKLFTLLLNIDMGNGDLSPQVRRWIRGISGGELLARDFTLFTEKESVLQNLLWADYRCVMGQPDASAAQVSQSLSVYLAPLGEFLDSVQDRFKPVKKIKPVEMEESLSSLCTTFCHNLESVPLIPEDEHTSPLSDLHQCLGEFQAIDPHADISYILGNIRNNLMISLEEKMRALAHLEPIDAASHFGSVLYTCQNIAESILINALQMRGVPLSFEEEAQHDLMAHVEKLGIRGIFPKEELDFLARGKTSRQLIRYPESRAKRTAPAAPQKSVRGRGKRKSTAPRPSTSVPTRLDIMQEMLQWGHKLSAKQSAADDLHGFCSADPVQAKRLEEIKRFALEDIALLSSVVKKVLGSCREILG